MGKKDKQPKENKEKPLDVYDIIACGTFVTSDDKFYDYLYEIYPELSRGIVTINTYTTHRFSTEEEKKDLFTKDKSKYIYAIFTPETLKIHHMKKISSNLENELAQYKESIKDSRADAIIEIERTGKNNATMRWHLIER